MILTISLIIYDSTDVLTTTPWYPTDRSFRQQWQWLSGKYIYYVLPVLPFCLILTFFPKKIHCSFAKYRKCNVLFLIWKLISIIMALPPKHINVVTRFIQQKYTIPLSINLTNCRREEVLSKLDNMTLTFYFDINFFFGYEGPQIFRA